MSETRIINRETCHSIIFCLNNNKLNTTLRLYIPFGQNVLHNAAVTATATYTAAKTTIGIHQNLFTMWWSFDVPLFTISNGSELPNKWWYIDEELINADQKWL